VDEIETVHKTGRPMLVGTTSIEKSERVSGMLQRRGIEHAVLNAKQHEREAVIVAEAGQEGRVTIATNMAGRGTDILLGPGIAARGGLHIVGTERHESRRIDNQLRGRAGRQGDPGSSQFFLSLEDDLMKKFAPEWVGAFLSKLGLGDGQDITSPMVSRAITRAQKKVEAYNFEIRKNLLEYDEVMDLQRKEVYGLRQRVLEGDDVRLREVIESMISRVVEQHVKQTFAKDASPEQRDPKALAAWFRRHFAVDVPDAEVPADAPVAQERLTRAALDRWRRREEEIGVEDMRRIERFLLLNSIDAKWKDHLRSMDGLKTGIGIRSYGQLDPKVEFKIEGHRMFGEMIWTIREEVTDLLFKVRLKAEEEEHLADRWGGATPTPPPGAAPPPPPARRAPPPSLAGPAGRPGGATKAPSGFEGARDGRPIGSEGAAAAAGPIRRDPRKVGRNDPCPCGSGKKYKKCHGTE
jgi:preprotein translocase subunit SecA